MICVVYLLGGVNGGLGELLDLARPRQDDDGESGFRPDSFTAPPCG